MIKSIIKDTIFVPQVFQTFLVSFNEQRRPIMPLLTQMRRTPKLSDEQRALREAWDTLTEKVSFTRILRPVHAKEISEASSWFHFV